MGILNYSTKISADNTVIEIHQILVSKGAKSIRSDYENGKVVAVCFTLELFNNLIEFRLPCNPSNVLLAMEADKSIQNSYKTIQQAERTAWRIIKDWVEAQMAIIEARQAEMAEVFMPYALFNGKTAYQTFTESQKLLEK